MWPALPRPFYIRSEASASFAVFHPATGGEGEERKTPVLFCSPWGWEDVASYRVRREWAARLAAGGFPTLRFDLPANGNSAGSVEDGGLASRWVSSIVAASTWLAETQDVAAVSAMGFGLGGMLAMLAVAAGAPIAALALWATPASGRRFVRETKAFAGMQTWYANGSGSGSGFDPGLPEGWVEAGGFALSPGTLAELGGLKPELGPGSSLRRALLLDRDGVAPPDSLREQLEGAGAEVTSASGTGWGALVSHPEEATLPLPVATELERWLAAQAPERAKPAGTLPAVEAVESIELAEDGEAGSEVRETAIEIEQRWGRTLGILAEPAAGRDSDLCAVFLNAGAVRATGPNRLWVETARRWAARGVPSLRLDLEGIGDADGDPAGYLRVADFYEPRYAGEVLGILDELERREAGRRFVLVGLCAGGYWAFRTAVEDPRVVASVQLNAGALRWDPRLLARREARKSSRALDHRWWTKLLQGEVAPRRIAQLLGSIFASALNGIRSLLNRPFRGDSLAALPGEIEADLEALRDSGTRALIAFSGEEPLGLEVESSRLAERGEQWPTVEFATLPGADHTLRPLAAQQAATELLDRELARLLNGNGAAPSAAPAERA